MTDQPKQITGEQASGKPAQNPFGPASITVLVPKTIKIKMVNASVLQDYEIWVFMTSILSSAFVGCGVAWQQAVDAKIPSAPAWGTAFIVFLLLFLITGGRALYRRSELSQESQEVVLNVSSATPSAEQQGTSR